MELENLVFVSCEPYPEIGELRQNPCYAGAMLDNVGGVNSEMSAICQYLANHWYLDGQCDLVSTIFEQLAKVEMQHLDLFATLAERLGETARLWTNTGNGKRYWSPCYTSYQTNPCQMVEAALKGEYEAIKKYQVQINCIDNEIVQACLTRVIADEELHVELLKALLAKLSEE